MRAGMAMLVCATMVMDRPGFALAPGKAKKMVQAARGLLGVRYQLGGRLRKPGEGTDCQGVIFQAAAAIGPCGWDSFSVFPTITVKQGELGEPVFGSDPVASADLKIAELEPGDMVFLVAPTRNPAEGPIGKLGGVDVWVWHTGMYTADGMWIVGDHHHGAVVEVPLQRYLDKYTEYSGALILRMKDGPKPQTCRHHPPMDRRAAKL
jgi:cell wall-associated NlpC family hydrolase